MRPASCSSAAGLRAGRGAHERAPHPRPVAQPGKGGGGGGGETPRAAARRAARLHRRLPARPAPPAAAWGEGAVRAGRRTRRLRREPRGQAAQARPRHYSLPLHPPISPYAASQEGRTHLTHILTSPAAGGGLSCPGTQTEARGSRQNCTLSHDKN